MNKSRGWVAEDILEIPPIKPTWAKGWHSIRHQFGIKAFGVNGATKDKGESITPEHDEIGTKHQELFVVITGKAEFSVDGKVFIGCAGGLVFVEPQIKRSAKALEDNTTVLIIGGPVGQAYEVGEWEKV